MSAPLVVCCCVGLTPAHIGPDTPNLQRLAADGGMAPMRPSLPAVTCSAQTAMLTGREANEHGIVANGWYFRELGEVWLWRQSERLIQAPCVWQSIRRQRQDYRVLKHFWWYAMNGTVDSTVTPRPVYHHDGRKDPDCYAWPPELKTTLTEQHGTFPLFHFWGPVADIRSSRWIAESFATAYDASHPDLALCYLPHLDYDLQRFGPEGSHRARNLRDLDACVGLVIDHARARGAEILIVSEYGIEAVDQAVFINRALREAGLLAVTTNSAGELLDPGMSGAFAVADHQIAHVYCRDAESQRRAADILGALDGIERCYQGDERAQLGLDHARSGELIAMAAPGHWFTFDYWLDDARKPDFAHCVEIHKKPGYDPRELHFDPRGGKWRAMRALMCKKLGLRYMLDPISLDTGLVKGSHGRPPARPEDGPLLIASRADWLRDTFQHTDVADLIQHHALA